MPKYLIDMPEGWKPCQCQAYIDNKSVVCPLFTNRKCGPACHCPLANAKKAVEISKDEVGELAFVCEGEPTPLIGKPVKLWATEE